MAANVGEIFTARAVMRGETAGTPVRWANTHEFRAAGLTGGLFIDAGLVADAVAAFHRALLLTNFYVESVTVSSYAEDGAPYNPDTFLSRTVMERGLYGGQITAEAPTTVLPITNTLIVKRQVDAGREGTLLLRGMLSEQDIQSDPLTGAITLVNAAPLQEVVSNAYSALLTGLNRAADMVLASGSGLSINTRNVSGLLVKGVGNKKLNNKYFNRGASPAEGIYEQLVAQYGPGAVGSIVEYLLGSGGTLPPLLP